MISLIIKLLDLIITSTPYQLFVKFKALISNFKVTIVEPDILKKNIISPNKSINILQEEISFFLNSNKEYNLINKAGTLSYQNLFHIILAKDFYKLKFKRYFNLFVGLEELLFISLINFQNILSMILTKIRLKC